MRLILLLALSSVSVFANDVLLNQRKITVETFNTTLITTKKTPRQVTIQTKAYLKETVCIDERFETYETTCEDCHQDLVCTGSGDDQTCQYVWNCNTYTCTKSDSWCVAWAPVYKLQNIKLLLKFGLFGPKAEQKLALSLPSKPKEDNLTLRLGEKTFAFKRKKNNKFVFDLKN